ncbi:MAG: translation initiation factor eIF-2B [Candidatus Omnitrophica bacterium]|nr:translation initiation factor eIF-2B [Candidatus Omnitrophota bacterium]
MKLNDIKKAVLVWGPISEEGILRIRQSGWLVVVAENRPFMVGLLHNCPLLKKKNIQFVYCTDNALGLLFQQNRIYKTIIFCKNQTKDGVFALTGSLQVALLSKLHNVKIEVAAAAQFQSEANVSTLGGKRFILNASKDDMVEAQDEFIEEEILK